MLAGTDLRRRYQLLEHLSGFEPGYVREPLCVED